MLMTAEYIPRGVTTTLRIICHVKLGPNDSDPTHRKHRRGEQELLELGVNCAVLAGLLSPPRTLRVEPEKPGKTKREPHAEQRGHNREK